MNLHRVLPSIAVAVVAVVALAGCGKITNSYGSAKSSGAPAGGAAQASSTPTSSGSGAGAVVPAGSTTVAIQNFTFTPQTLTVKAGTKVTWTNKDSTVHDVTSTNGPGTNATTTSTFASGTLNSGQSFSFTFTKAGTYFYECSIHAMMASMHAKIIVK